MNKNHELRWWDEVTSLFRSNHARSTTSLPPSRGASPFVGVDRSRLSARGAMDRCRSGPETRGETDGERDRVLVDHSAQMVK